jgi:hypothetical protein
MTKDIIVVPEVAVRVVTGDTCYQYENGFSAIYAEITAGDGSVAEQQLSKAHHDGCFVTVRCAMLDVIGRITKCSITSSAKTFVLPIDDITYRKPHDQ